MAKQIGFDNPDVPAVEFLRLLEGAGCPVGNLRIREAWERVRVAEETAKFDPCRGISLDDILQRTDAFRWVAERFALVASGSSGVQGEWPKILFWGARRYRIANTADRIPAGFEHHLGPVNYAPN